MPRKVELTDEQRAENKKNLDSYPITINVNKILLDKINKFAKNYQSKNKAIIDLIKNNPDFISMFPKYSDK